MAYADAALTPRQKLASAGLVAGLHGVIGVVLVAGLAATGVIDIPDRLESDFVPVPENTPLPPPPPPEPQPDQPRDNVAPPVDAPVPPLPIPQPDRFQVPSVEPTPYRGPIVLDPGTLPTGRPTGVPSATPTPTPPPPPAFTPKGPEPRNNPGSWATTNDYPSASIRRQEQGATTFRVTVGTDGRVKACEITRSSGSSRLDDATCANVSRRARFNAATDDSGAKVVGTYTNTIRWVLPD